MEAAEDVGGHGYINPKGDYVKRLRRIKGQARGLQLMVEDEKYCIDILTRVSAGIRITHNS
jgi:DNA-binding FrmR family transcriptional regulator